MSFYQAVAEVGPSFCTAPNKFTQCENSNGDYSADAIRSNNSLDGIDYCSSDNSPSFPISR